MPSYDDYDSPLTAGERVLASAKGKPGYPAGGSGYARIARDFYCEPRWCVVLVLRMLATYGEPIIGTVTDPFCGSGTIVSVCLDHGISAHGSDIVDRGFGEVRDAFTIPAFENVISNIPYRLAYKCIRYLVPRTSGRVILILRLGMWESRARNILFCEFPPLWWAPCSDRPSMPPGVIDVSQRDHHGAFIQPESKGGKAPYAWFCFQRDYHGPIGGARLLDLRPKLPRRADSARVRGLSATVKTMEVAK